MEETSDIHPHCLTCINVKKCVSKRQQDLHCDIVPCSLNCGFVFHACKMAEHLLLCPNKKVPCYNFENGCPVKMARKNLAQHLTTCPASVIHCTMEWNRSLKAIEHSSQPDVRTYCLSSSTVQNCMYKPLSGFHREIIPCPRTCTMKYHACKKDQHLLLCAKVPAQWRNLISTIEEHDVDKSCPGIPSKDTSLQYGWCPQHPPLDIALTLRDLRILQWHNSSNNLQQKFQEVEHRLPDYMHISPEPVISGYDCGLEEANDIAMTEQLCLHRSLINQNTSNLNSNSGSDQNSTENGDLTSSPTDDENKSQENLLANFLNNLRILDSDCNKLCDGYSENCLANGSASETVKNNLNNCDNWEKTTSRDVSPDESHCSAGHFGANVVNAMLSYPTRFLGLGPKLGSEFPTRSNEYTFLCSQEFRRDEFPWHYKNVHCDIQGSLNGCLLERCPLAQYGCTFSRQKLNPLPEGSKVVYSGILESFGYVPPPPKVKDQMCSVNWDQPFSIGITDLPFEVLQHIIGFLDSFSLSNFSCTSQLMSAVCQTILITRGIVTVNWEKTENGGIPKWKDTGKKWCFSSHFTPIHNWTIEDSNCMSSHLKTCKFNVRNIRTQPYRHGESLETAPTWKHYKDIESIKK